jgi:hypothetical protein
MTNTLVTALQLAPFPGSPFDDQHVDAAVADIRAEAGWHIAPVVTETVTVSTSGGWGLLILPSLKVATVTAVRDVTNVTPRTVTGWRLRPGGLLYLAYTGSWTCGYYEVDLQHGYATTPKDLLPVIASRAAEVATASSNRLVSQQRVSLDDYSEQSVFRGTTDPVLARYSLPPPVA